jgi:hypothetical protein
VPDSLYNAVSGLDWSEAPTVPTNFAFGDGLVGWYVGHEATGYRLTYSPHGFNGRPCAVLTATHAPMGGWQCIVQNVRAVNYRGKHVRLSGWMKTENVDGVAFGLRLDCRSSVTSLAAPTVAGTTGWTKYSIVFDVPADAQGFAVAPGNLSQHGRFWLADMRLDDVDQTTPLTTSSSQPDYPGDTARVVHTWMLSRRGELSEALAESVAIADDPTATKEERCTALEADAVVSMALGDKAQASGALANFGAMSKGLTTIDPGVLAEAARTRAALNASVRSTVTALGRWQNANGNDWSTVPSTPRNLNFANGLEGWMKATDGGDAPDYTAGTTAAGYAGRPAAFLRAIDAQPGTDVVLCQWFRADRYLGKRVRITAVVRRTGSPSKAQLYAHLDTRRNFTFWDGPQTGPIATSDWRQYSLVLDVPEDGQGIILGGFLDGRGTVWLADVHVDVVDTRVPLTPGGTTVQGSHG